MSAFSTLGMETDFGSLIRRSARRFGNREAFICDGFRFTYRDIQERSCRLANALLGLGLRPGERVATLLFNGHVFVEAFFALAKAGIIIVPVNRRLSDGEIVKILNDCQVSGLIYDAEFAASAEVFRQEVPSLRVLIAAAKGATPDDDSGYGSVTDSHHYHKILREAKAVEPGVPVEGTDIQAIYYTSGTTGMPKGVIRTHISNMFMIQASLIVAPMNVGETWFCALPMTSAALFGLGPCAWVVGGRTIAQRTFEPEEVPRLIQDEGVTHAILGPTMWEMTMAVPGFDRFDMSSLKYAFWGGMPLQVGTAERLREWLPVPCGGCYGLTEVPCVSWGVGEVARQHPTSCGQPAPFTSFRICDTDGQELQPGELGEVQIRSPILMKEYYNRPTETAEVFKDGWFHTGDLGYIDTDGNLFVVDRIKDMIISGGENIYPVEVENVISTMPQVAEVAVIGVPDPLWGQAVCAYVVPRPGEQLEPEQVIDYCRGRIANYKRPRHVRIVSEIPKNQMGKFEKVELLRRWTESNTEN